MPPVAAGALTRTAPAQEGMLLPSRLRSVRDSPTGTTRIQLWRWIQEFTDAVSSAANVPLYDGPAEQVEVRIGNARMALSAASTSVANMRDVWPEGEPIYQNLATAIRELAAREKHAREFFEIIGSRSPIERSAGTIRQALAKNRQHLLKAGACCEEAARLLHDWTGLTLAFDPEW